jgi:alpha-D-ribose 1-methylphosphonate 5-triphosphate synthase subunit PhnH
MSASAFADPVFQSQATFRALLDAISRPGEIVAAGAGLAPPSPLRPAAAAALLTLADFETAIWLSPRWAGSEAAAWLRFHTGAPTAASPERAAFALVEAETLDLSRYAQGIAEYPDRSTTLIVDLDHLTAEGDLILSGPGVKGERRLGFAPRPADFLSQWRANHAAFPLGVDLILAAEERLAALPRTTRLREAG